MMRAVAVCLVLVAASTCTGIAAGGTFGAMNAAISILALAAGSIAAFAVAKKMPKEQEHTPGVLDNILLAVFLLAACRAFFWLLYEKDGLLEILSPNNLGDISLHLNFIQYLARASPLWPPSPILAGTVLTYPIGIDFFNALLFNLHLDLRWTLIVMGLAGSAMTAYSLWKWGGAFALAVFLFGGGWVAFLIRCGVQLPEEQWKNPFLALFVTQRGWLYALPVCMLLLWSWRSRMEDRNGLPRGLEVLFYGTLPLFNVHAFLFLSVILAAAWTFGARKRMDFFRLGALAFAPALLSALLVTNRFRQTGDIRVQVGWLQDESGPLFWVLNFGLLIPLALALLFVIVRKGNAVERAFVGASIFVFVLCTQISFAPWPWDNTKLMLLAWLAMAPFLWERIIRPTAPVVRVLLCGLLFLPGAVSFYKGLDRNHGYGLIPRAELDAARSAVETLPPEERIACAPEYNHPIILTGRPVVAGYFGHLWSHGLDYKSVWKTLPLLMNGSEDWKAAARSLGIHYLYWGPREMTTYPASQRPWEKCAGIVAQSSHGTLWDLRPCLEQVTESSPDNPSNPPPP